MQDSKEPKIIKRNRTLELLVVGVILGFVCGMPIGLGLFADAADHIQGLFTLTISFLIAFSVLIFITYLFKDKIFKWLSMKILKVPHEMASEFTNTILAIHEKDKISIESSATKLAEMTVSYLAWFRLRRWLFNLLIGVILAFTGLAGSALLYQQNKILVKQEQWFTQQTAHSDNQSNEATRSSLFAHAMEIQNNLIQNPELYAYFYSSKPITSETELATKQKALIISEMICDMLDHASASSISDNTKAGWSDYANDMYNSSPVFKEFLDNRISWYPSIRKWIKIEPEAYNK